MYRKWISALYVLNITFQSFFSLLTPVGLAVLLGWVTTEKWGAPSWLYVPLIIVGVFSGLLSMIRFILSATKSLDALEREQEHSIRERRKKENKDKDRLSRRDNVGE